MKSIVITGSSSGIGKATAKHFAAAGWRVAATMRKPEKETELNQIENISVYALDVTSDQSVASAAAQILADFGRVDVVLNNAGYGLIGPFEMASTEQIKRQFDTNVFGLMSVTRAFLPHFRANKAGMFLNVSSIGGRITFPVMSLYHSTKWAVEGLSESMSYELAELGITVKIIEPGGVSTNFSGSSLDMAIDPEMADYMPTVGAVQKYFTQGGSGGGSTAEQIAAGIYEATTDGKKQLRYLLGEDAKQMYAMRQQVGDDQFIAGMTERMLKSG